MDSPAKTTLSPFKLPRFVRISARSPRISQGWLESVLALITGLPDADRGAHEFTYALFPHAGDWVTAETVRRAWELNVPIVCTPGTGRRTDSLGEHATFKVEGPALLETVKPAEDGDGYILRLYEPHGGRGPVRVHTPLPLERVIACNHVEENGDEWPTQAAGFDFPIGPFEIKTFRVNFQSKDGVE